MFYELIKIRLGLVSLGLLAAREDAGYRLRVVNPLYRYRK